MRFAGERYRAPGFRMRDYNAQSGSIGKARAQSGSAGMPGIMTNYQAPSAQQIVMTEMPAARQPQFKAQSGAIGAFSAPIRL